MWEPRAIREPRGGPQPGVDVDRRLGWAGENLGRYALGIIIVFSCVPWERGFKKQGGIFLCT